jgi:prepilin-type N-terminal cleavage/methylation domain-containing protein
VPRLSRPSPRPPRAAARPTRAGFTLVELLISIVILAVVMTALVKVFSSQQQLYTRTREAADVQRDLRMGFNMLPVDLRSAATAPVIGVSDLADLSDSALSVRATIGQSIICNKVPLPLGAPSVQIDLPPLNLASHTLTTWHAEPTVGDIVLLYNDSTSIGPEDDYWDQHVIVAKQELSTTCTGGPFTDPALDAGKMRFRLTLNRPVADSVRLGAGVRFLRWARYSLFRPSGVGTSAETQWYLGYRENPGQLGWEATQPIAGPFRPAGGSGPGIGFSYFDANGVALAAPVNPRAVARIDLTFRAQARVRGAGATEYAVRDSLALRVAMRNRPVLP